MLKIDWDRVAAKLTEGEKPNQTPSLAEMLTTGIGGWDRNRPQDILDRGLQALIQSLGVPESVYTGRDVPAPPVGGEHPSEGFIPLIDGTSVFLERAFVTMIGWPRGFVATGVRITQPLPPSERLSDFWIERGPRPPAQVRFNTAVGPSRLIESFIDNLRDGTRPGTVLIAADHPGGDRLALRLSRAILHGYSGAFETYVGDNQTLATLENVSLIASDILGGIAEELTEFDH